MGIPRKPDVERARPNKWKAKDAAQQSNALPEWDGVVRGPGLPSGDWSVATKEWWMTWRCSPQAMLCSPTDWEAMLVAAQIHNRMHSRDQTGKYPSHTSFVNMSSELRRITGSIGGSYEDRQALGFTVRSDKDAHDEVTPQIEEAVGEVVDYFERMRIRQAEAKARLNGVA